MKIADQKVSFIDKMGSDLSVVNAARVSFGKRKDKFDSTDKSLIDFLAKHDHWSPFAHTSVSLRVKAPIFVARQLAKHQVGAAWNEESRRYISSEPEFYVPSEYRLKADNVKQGSSDNVADNSSYIEQNLIHYTKQNLNLYKDLMKDHNICPEQARMVLPQNTMTEWVWTGSVLFFARVCNLRLDNHTQKETREVAQMIYDIVCEQFPYSVKALVKGDSNA